MAGAGGDRPYRFSWHISNPFVPCSPLQASFYTGSNAETQQWQVTFLPCSLELNHWQFSFSLWNVKFGPRDDVIVADQLRVCIRLNGNEMERQRERNYSFSGANTYTYYFLGNLYTPPVRTSLRLTIEVQLTLPNPNIVDQRNEPLPLPTDLTFLADDLRELLDHHQYSNLKLMSRYPTVSTYNVHSDMIRERWCNFFEVHPARTIIDGTVVVHMSNYILWTILKYMYSGRINMTGPVLGNMIFRTEFFQVMDRYKIHHLYKVFETDYSRQERRTMRDQRTNVRDFRADGIHGPPLDGRSFTWRVDPNTNHEISFQIKFYLSEDVPRFHYSLRSPHRLHVQVYLELVRRLETGQARVNTVHGQDYSIRNNDPVESGIRHFEGNPANTNDFLNGVRRRGNNRIEHFIRCVLYSSNGSTGVTIEREGRNRLQGLVQGLWVLSDHMGEVLARPERPDLRLSCPIEWPAYPIFPNALFRLHKCIFTARVPHWRNVLENVPEEHAVPDAVTCGLGSEAFRYFIAYIYTAKIFPIPARYQEEVQEFTERGGLNSLREFLVERRLLARNL